MLSQVKCIVITFFQFLTILKLNSRNDSKVIQKENRLLNGILKSAFVSSSGIGISFAKNTTLHNKQQIFA